MKQFDSRDEATAWLAALPAAVQLAGQSRKDNEGLLVAVIRFADKLTQEWVDRGGNTIDRIYPVVEVPGSARIVADPFVVPPDVIAIDVTAKP